MVIVLLVGGTAPWWWTEFFGGKAPSPAPPAPPAAAVKYVVTERNPFSGGVESAREFAQANQPAFTRVCRGPQSLGAVPAFTALGEAAAIVAARVACDTIAQPAAPPR